MPKVAKIRVTNVLLDDKLKVIPNRIWDLRGGNSLFLLENGGGKTSIIQLIHQVVTPNVKIQGRAIADTVAKKTTFHVAVEWMPDDEERLPFITGFCFNNHGQKATQNTNPYDYLSYHYEVGDEDYPIEDLPFIDEGRSRSLFDLERLLKQTGIRTFKNKVGEYTRELEAYGIFQSEWASIAKVNGDEGGVEGFFAKTKTVDTLISNLLIPSLERSLYDTEEESVSILNTFKKHKETLMDLPKMERSIEDFQVIERHSGGIIEAATQYGEARQELFRYKYKLGGLRVAIEQETDKTNSQIWEHEDTKRMTEEEIKKLEYRIDSFPIHEETLKEKRFEEAMEDLQEKQERTKKLMEFYKRKVEEQEAARSFKRYRDFLSDKVNDESSLALLQMDEDEQWKVFEEAQKKVSAGNRFLSHRIDTQIAAVKEELKENRQMTDQQESAASALQQEITKTEKIISVAENDITRYQREKEQLVRELDDLWTGNMDGTMARIESELVRTKSGVELNVQRQKETIENIQQNQLKKKGSEYQQTELSRQLEEAKDTLAAYHDFVQTLIEQAVPFMVMNLDDLFRQRERFEELMVVEENRRKVDLLEVNLQLKQAKMEQEFLSEKGFIAHPELNTIKEHLEDRGLDVILGIEYLLRHEMPEEEKTRLVNQNPLLMFSILYEEGQFNRLSKELERTTTTFSIPVVLLDKKALDFSGEEKGIIYSITDYHHIFHRFERRFTELDWHEYLGELEASLERLEQNRLHLEHEVDKIQETRRLSNTFYDRYNGHSVNQYTEAIQDIEGLIEKEEQYQNELTDTIAEWEQVLAKVESLRLEFEQELRDLHMNEKSIREFLDRHPGIEETRKRRETATRQLLKLQKQLRDLKETVQALRQEREQMSARMNANEYFLALLTKDKTELGLLDLPMEKMDEDQYNRHKDLYSKREKEMSYSAEKRKGIQERILKSEARMKEEANEITKYGFNVDNFSELSIIHSESLLDELREEYEDYKAEFYVNSEKVGDLTSERNATKMYVERLLKELQEKYDTQEAYPYGDDAQFERQDYQQAKSRAEGKRDLLIRQIQTAGELIRDYERSLDSLRAISREIVDSQGKALQDDEWDKKNPHITFRELMASHLKWTEKVRDREDGIKESIREMVIKILETDNQPLRAMAERLKQFLDQSTQEAEYLITAFQQLSDTVQGYKQAFEIQRKEVANNELELLEMMYKRAEEMYDHICELEKSSYIEMEGDQIPMIKVKWQREEQEEARNRLKWYMKRLLVELADMELAGRSQDDIDRYVNRELRMDNILDCYAQISRCRVTVLKPRNKELKEHRAYFPWDQASSWSGGERHTFQITMFISLNTLLRKKKVAKENANKFLIIDNPFGAASSVHVVYPMIDLARKTNTQLFCFTDINKEGILNSFETVISNKFIKHINAVMLDSKTTYNEMNIDSLYYHGA